MIRYIVFPLVTWLVVALPLTALFNLYSPLPTGVFLTSIGVALPYAALMWFALQKPIPRLRKLMMQGISVGYASAAGVLASWPLAATGLAENRAGIAILVALCVLFTGVYLAVFPRVRTLDFRSKKIGKATRIVQLTDVHLGSFGPGQLARSLALASAQAPDFIVITGDLVDGGEVGKRELAPLATCTVPVFMVIGNHERYVSLDTLLADIGAQGVHILRNESVEHSGVQLVGIDDSDAAQYLVATLPTVPTSDTLFNVLLYHKPDDWSAACAEGIDLMLSGHTHAGQVWPFSLLVKRRHPEWRGLYSTGGQHLYVAPGTGCWGPIYRMGSRAEVTVINLIPDN